MKNISTGFEYSQYVDKGKALRLTLLKYFARGPRFGRCSNVLVIFISN